ncbi:MAG: hypothetical protein LBT40_07970 [Deltaproteobacteria bacterium]|jgi:hypothetical protein|nr:hypothetical protein [Deltaproteobacteria bacterium]
MDVVAKIDMFMSFGGIIVTIFMGVGIFSLTRLFSSQKSGFADLRREIIASEARTEKNIADVKTSVTGLETKMEGRISEVKTSISKVDDKLGALTETVSNLRVDVGKLQVAVNGLVAPSSDWKRSQPQDDPPRDDPEEVHHGRGGTQAGSRKAMSLSE